MLTVVGFKKFCVSIPLKGDLKGKIKCPTGVWKKEGAEEWFMIIFRALWIQEKVLMITRNGAFLLKFSI